MTGLWFEITARVPPAQAEAVSAVMRDISPGGITVEEPVDILGPELGYRVRPGEPLLVRAYLPASELGAVLTEELRRAMEAFPAVELVAKPIHQQDWAVSWREFFGVVDYGGRILVVPSWIDHEAAPGQVTIRLDPGQAFGTGHHETTRLCLAALEDSIANGMAVLDVGTGSGILAIAAIRLGAASVAAVDVDPIAAEVARANCIANGIGAEVSINVGALEASHPGRYDVVVANISTPANTALAAVFGNVVRPGGRLILSGILAPDAAAVREAMAAHGLALSAMRHERDWCLLELVRS
ncbi:MAG: 50S ribosomal protein L11 methyltransferase [Dehalococcoidia bacterium]|nr:50S ribosomal protein L11 methyltransferase [Chloroflexi bacterium CFX7]MCK6564480.1 50S ribosomal protein L11 methyltransferase [Dehalococcoidia bacterium]NUQ54740.1 50S ribosomal protein L11 methyltransferase [Dehalococcoidia bacterium]RIL01596.1 MAG: 50S ribosomal protein L11 methyltransferase [bacterium]